MILERDKKNQLLEAKATQAIDLVQTIQPDKLMIELRKGDAKIEALRANVESNEVIVKNALSEIKGMRAKIQAFSGVEQTIKMSEEVKAELMEIRKMNANLERHADKVETIYAEMQKRFSDFAKFSDNLADIGKASKAIGADLDSIKAKISNFAAKKDVDDMKAKYSSFEKHVTDMLSLINRKFDSLEKDLKDKFAQNTEKSEKMLKGFEMLAQKTPDLNKYFHLLEAEANKAPNEENPEKIKKPGEEEKDNPEKKGLFSKLKDKVAKKPAEEKK